MELPPPNERKVTMSVPPIKKKTSELRVAVPGLLLPLYVAVGFASFIGALHAPAPHDVKVAVVGPPATVVPLAQGISARARGALNISQITSVADARRAVAERKLVAAYVPMPAPTPTIIVASAASAGLANFAESTFRQVAATQGRLLAVDDVKPLPAGNASGIANFFFILICTLAGFLTAVTLGTVSPKLPETRRLALIASAAIAAPTVVYLIGGAGFGAFNGSFGTIIAMIGMGALYTATVALITRGLQIATGRSGFVLASLIFIFLNVPTSGGVVPGQLLPGFWRFLHQFWIGASALDANRSILYFGGAGTGTAALKILAWLAGWAGLVAVILIARTRQQWLPSQRQRALRLALGLGFATTGALLNHGAPTT
jgi:hypothetical protein